MARELCPSNEPSSRKEWLRQGSAVPEPKPVEGRHKPLPEMRPHAFAHVFVGARAD